MLSLLPSDYCLLIIFSTISFAIWQMSRSKLQEDFWRQLFQSSVACVSAVIVLFFMLVTLLDSIHFSENGSYYTALDKLIAPIGVRDETSFSKPMATHSFVYETKTVNNKILREKPPLKHVSGRSTQQNIIHILLDVSYALITLFACILIINLVQKKYGLARWFTKPNRPIILTIFAIVAACIIVKDFANHYYVLGTDKVGVDVLYILIKGIRTGLSLGLITIMLMVPLAIIMGLSAGYFGGRIDAIIQYVYTTLSSIPGVLLIAAAVLSLDMYMYKNSNIFSNIAFRADMRLLALCCILGFTGWTSLCRLLRGEALKLRELDFVVHARVSGMSSLKIIVKHLLPNVMHIVIITSVLDFSGLVLAEAVLSYLGVGVDASMYSWGNIINSARLELARDPVVWWPLIGAITIMFLLVLSVNLLADKVRAIRDPRRL